MPVTIPESDIALLKSTIKSQFRSVPGFASAAGLKDKDMSEFFRLRTSPEKSRYIAERVLQLTGLRIQIEERPRRPLPSWNKAGVPTFSNSQRPVFNQMVRDAGFSASSLLRELGFPPTNINSLFRNRVSADLFHRLRDAILSVTGIDLSDPALFPPPEDAPPAPGPLLDLHTAGLITDAEMKAGAALAEAAGDRAYPGREPLSSLFRTWPKDLQTMWSGLMRADAETDRCRPRLPTASLVAWNVCAGREALDLKDPYSRDAITSLRLGLQHLENLP